jgi:outer membrane protein TolC
MSPNILAQEDLNALEAQLEDNSPEASSPNEIQTVSDSKTESPKSSISTMAPSEEIPSEVGFIDSQQDKIKADARTINLRQVLEEGLRKNPYEQIRKHNRAKVELVFDNAFESFWYPNMNLFLQTDPQRINRLVTDNSGTSTTNPSPAGIFGLEIGDYTVFNWGRDYLDYLNSKNTFERSKQRLNEERRKLRFGLISQYFNVIRIKNLLRVKRDQLRQSSFAHRMAKEKLNLGKIKVQEFYQTKTEFLRAQTDYQELLFHVTSEEEILANLLGDDPRASYRPEEQLHFKNLNVDQGDALKSALSFAPAYLEAKMNLENSARSYQKTLKDNMPLPKFSVNLGAYTYDYNNLGAVNNYNTDPYGNRNIDLVASINMKWAIFGDGGLFNTRTNQLSFLDKRIAEIGFFNTKRELEVKIKNIFKTVRFLENKVQFAQFQSANAQKTLDSAMDNYLAGRSTFPDIKLALDGYVESQITLENAKFTHLLKKLELADLMGLEDFIGDNFEQLAVK